LILLENKFNRSTINVLAVHISRSLGACGAFFGPFVSRVVSVWFGLPNMNGVQSDSLERWSVQVERNMSKAVLVPRNT